MSLPHWKGFKTSLKCLNIVCHGTLFEMIIPLWSGTTAVDLWQAYREGWQRWARDPKQVVLDPAGENLHDIFLDRLELKSVVANDRAFKMGFKFTQPKDKREFERATQIRQAARQAFVECQDDKVMRRALVARPRPWREFQVGDQVPFWRKRQGSWHETWSRSLVRLSSDSGIVSWFQEMCGWHTDISYSRCLRNRCAWPQSRRGLQMM